MSMILDALSRVERERRREQHHELDAGRYVTSSTIKEDRFKKWVFVALLFNFSLIIVILVGYLWKTDSLPSMVKKESVVTPAQVSVTQSQPRPLDAASQVEVSTVNQTVSNPPLTDNASLLDEAQVNNKPAPVVKKPIAQVVKQTPPVSYSSKPLTQPKQPSIPVEELLAVETSNTSQDYMLLSDLAPGQRTKLNKYEVNVHVYDDNAQNSFVLINMTKYKEGDRLPGGQEHVASIVPEGVIIDFGSGRVLIERN